MIERNDERPDERELCGALDTTIESGAGEAQPAAEGAELGEVAQAEPTVAPTKRAPRRKAAAKRTDGKAERGSILQMPAREAHEARRAREVVTDEQEREAAELHELEAQGFTLDEAQRLLYISDRLSTSREAREAEATLRRLRFTRWLIEHGVLDEFSA